MILFSNLGTEELQCSVNTSFTLYLYWTSTCRNFFYMIIIFVVLASLLPKCGIMRYLRFHLGFSGFGILALLALFKRYWHFLAFWHFGIFFLILAFWLFWNLWHFWHLGILRSKKYIIKDQSCLDFGIFALSCCFLLNLIMPKCQRCQKCQNGQNAKMQKKMPKCQKMPAPFKKCKQYQDTKTRKTKVTSEISHDAAFRN